MAAADDTIGDSGTVIADDSVGDETGESAGNRNRAGRGFHLSGAVNPACRREGET
jgi:hypothetical protein